MLAPLRETRERGSVVPEVSFLLGGGWGGSSTQDLASNDEMEGRTLGERTQRTRRPVCLPTIAGDAPASGVLYLRYTQVRNGFRGGCMAEKLRPGSLETR